MGFMSLEKRQYRLPVEWVQR